MNLLDRIQLLCQEKNTTVYRVEKDCGFSNAVISKWNTANPSIEKVIKVADYFGVTIEYLCGLTDAEDHLRKANHVTIMDAMNRCKALQDAGHNVSLELSFGETRIEHRNNEDCELIAKFVMRDMENQEMLQLVDMYLDTLSGGCKTEKVEEAERTGDGFVAEGGNGE